MHGEIGTTKRQDLVLEWIPFDQLFRRCAKCASGQDFQSSHWTLAVVSKQCIVRAMNVTMKDKLKARLRELLKERPIKARFRREFRRRMMPYGELRAVPVRAIFHHMRNCICKRFLMQTRASRIGPIRLPSRVETDQD